MPSRSGELERVPVARRQALDQRSETRGEVLPQLIGVGLDPGRRGGVGLAFRHVHRVA